jgi:mannose-6-phosphate isomerase
MMYKFKPLLKQTLWGGNKIIAFKHLDLQMEHVGESWEVSGIKGCESVVAGGPDEGKGLNQLVHEQKGLLVGKENYERFGDEFPLLIKFIDAHQNLSIQVHPDDETARRHGKGHGKSEMWYVLKSASGAQIFNGLRQHITPEEYKQMVEDGTIVNALAHYTVHEGDVFFIPAGRIHSIGAGAFVAEIQQTSDVTYRIYDFKRKDKNGNYRELHTEKAAEAIDYTVHESYRTYYEPMQDEGVQLIACPHFTTAVYDLNDPMTIDYSELDSFVVYIGLQGSCELTDDHGETISFREGESVLIPATTRTIKVEGTIKFLETYV